MNNNNRGNNRRRGRGNNNRQGGGGGQQLNRIDSRARGNAPQLLEKYRKLAHDAHLNGDRVQEEYYLQFADHYFRVLADQRQRQDEQRGRRDERWQEGGEEGEDAGEYAPASDFSPYDQQSGYQRPPRPSAGPAPQDDRGREERPAREGREPRGESVESGDNAGGEYEAAENPFVRDNSNRGPRGLKPRRAPRQAQDDRESRPRGERAEHLPVRDDEGEPAGFDASLLPPAINAPKAAPEAGKDEEAPAPRRRTRRPKATAEEAAE